MTGARAERAEPPVIIVGSPRSGTSLISRIIGSHPAIAVPRESHFYNTFVPWLEYYGDLRESRNRERLLRDVLDTAPLRRWIPRVDRRAAGARIEANGRFDLNGIIAGIMETWCDALGKPRWGEKTPHHLFFADSILEGFPAARFVHIVRDGRAVAASWKRARFGPKHVYPAALRWVDNLEAARRLEERLGPKQFFEFRYEDLLRDPGATVRQICDFLDVEYVSDMLDPRPSHERFSTDVRNRENLAKGVIAENAIRWHLSPRETRIFEAVAGEALQARGYERACPNASLSNLERLTCKYLEHPPRKVVAMATNRHGLTDGLIRTRIYLRLRIGL